MRVRRQCFVLVRDDLARRSILIKDANIRID
jgi:hypothetical protein